MVCSTYQHKIVNDKKFGSVKFKLNQIYIFFLGNSLGFIFSKCDPIVFVFSLSKVTCHKIITSYFIGRVTISNLFLKLKLTFMNVVLDNLTF